MDKIIISAAEVAETKTAAEQPGRLEPQLPPVVPWWAKASMSLLVLVLPVLCLVAIVLRVAMRNLPPRTRQGWTAFVNTLLIISGLLTSAAAVVVFSFVPLPAIVATGLTELDERADFPHTPTTKPMTAREVSQNLKPLVAVISPLRRSWLNHQEMADASFGAGTSRARWSCVEYREGGNARTDCHGIGHMGGRGCGCTTQEAGPDPSVDEA